MAQADDEITYDALNFDGLERRGNYRIIAYREDVLHALDRKDPAAIIYQIVYRWQVEYKKPEVLKKIEARKKAGLKPYTPKEIEDMMYVFMSYNDFVKETGGAVGYNTVIRMIDFLVHTKKVLHQKENHDPKYPDFEYSVNKEAMRLLLQGLPVHPLFTPKIPKKKNKSTQMGISDTSTQMGTPTEEIDSTQMGTQSTQMGTQSTQMGTQVYPNGGTSHNYSHTTHNELTEKENVGLSDDEANDAHHLLPENQNKTHPASYRPSEGPNERHANNPLAHSSTAHPTPDRDAPDEQQPEIDPLHVAPNQDTLTGAQQAITPTFGETAQAQQLERQANSDNPAVAGCDDTPAPAGKEMTPPEPEATTQAAPTTTATTGGKKGSAKGDASTTGVGGKVEKPTRQRKPAPLTPEEQLALEPELVQAIVREWRDIFTKKPKPVTPTMIQHARTLAQYKPEPGEIIACRLWLYATDKNKYYDGHGMTLGTIASSFERFQSLTEVPKPMIRNGKTTETPKKMDEAKARAESNNLDQLEKLRQRAAQKAVAPKGVSSYAV